MDEIKRKDIIEMIKLLSYYFDKWKDKLCEPYGLSSIQSKVIIDIYHHEGSRITDICERLNKETNTISPLINRLISYDYLKKVNNKEDRRVYYIYLTDKSKKIMKSLTNDVEKTTWPLFDLLKDEELEMIYQSLKKLIDITKE